MIQDLMKRGWLSHTKTDHQRLGGFGMRNHPFQILESSPAIFGRSSHSVITPEYIPHLVDSTRLTTCNDICLCDCVPIPDELAKLSRSSY